MKKIISITMCSTVLSSAVLAGHAYDGFKMGAQVGGVFSAGKARINAFDRTNNVYDTRPANKSERSPLLGLHLGWDKVSESGFLFGIELFGDRQRLTGKVGEPHRNQNSLYMKASSDYSFGANGRLGYVFEKTALYIGLGWVGTHWKLNGVIDSTVNGGRQTSFAKTKILSGLRLSAGMGTALSDKILASIEGGYTIYKSIKAQRSFSDPFSFGNNALATAKYKPSAMDVKFKVSYKI